MLVDPAGFRWLSQTWLKVDRGVAFYNHASIPVDTPFALSRLGLVLVGLAAVGRGERRLARVLRGTSQPGRLARFLRRAPKRPPADETGGEPKQARPLAALGMRTRPPGFVRGLLSVARAEAATRILTNTVGDASRLAAEGRGESDPISTNATPEGREENRRIEIILHRPSSTP